MGNIKDLEQIIKGGKVFKDDRGIISNYELEEKINWIGLITSKKSSMRSNHYHKYLTQNCFLVSGKYISILKDLREENSPIITQIINEGDLSIIPPMVVHVMIFLENSVFINLVNGERNHENYGKGTEHTTPYQLITEEQKEDLLKNYKSNCRICSNNEIKRVISFGLQPLANNLLENNKQKDELYPLELGYCEKCHNCQLSYVVPPDKLFKNYLYKSSSTGDSFRNHFKKAAEKYIKEFELNEKSLVVEIGGNDGIFLRHLQDKNIQTINIEPAENIAKLSKEQGIDTICGFFVEDGIAKKILRERGFVDLVTASNVFAHTDKIKQLTLDVFELLKKDGVFVIECQYLYDTIKDLTFDNIYHEHVSYFSVTSLNNFFNSLDLVLFHVEHINTHGGSIRCYIGRKENSRQNSAVNKFLEKEMKTGILKWETYERFLNRVEEKKEIVLKNIKKLKDSGKRIVGYGSPAKATTVLNYYGIDNKYIDFIIEDNELKHNKFLPGVRIPIKSKKDLDYTPDYVLVLAWNFLEEIKRNNQDLLDKGVQFITLNDLDVFEDIKKKLNKPYKFLLPIPPKEIEKELEDYEEFGDHIIF